MATNRMRKFDDWQEAEEWARETDRSLEPIGSYTGDEDERMIAQYFHTDLTKVEMWERVAEVSAIGERNTLTIGVTEYIVVVHRHGQHDTIYHADDWQEANDRFDYESENLQDSSTKVTA